MHGLKACVHTLNMGQSLQYTHFYSLNYYRDLLKPDLELQCLATDIYYIINPLIKLPNTLIPPGLYNPDYMCAWFPLSHLKTMVSTHSQYHSMIQLVSVRVRI